MLQNPSMSITYSNDPVQRMVLEAWRGDIDAADIRSHWTRMLADPISLSIRRSLTDIREAIPQLTAEELERVVDEVLIPGLKGRLWISAAVVATADQLRLTHRYRAAQRLNEVSVFSDPDTALKWLLHQESPT
jgi:hypothetical protein